MINLIYSLKEFTRKFFFTNQIFNFVSWLKSYKKLSYFNKKKSKKIEIVKNIIFINVFPKIINNSLKSLSIILCYLFLTTININYTYSQEVKHKGIGRVRACVVGSDGKIEVEPMETINLIDPKDIEFSATNDVCRVIAVTAYVDVKASIAIMNAACGSGSVVPRPFPSPIQDSYELGKALLKVSGSTACSLAYINALRSYTTTLVSFSVVNAIARAKFSNVKICGSGWKIANPKEYLINTPGVEAEVNTKIETLVNNGSSNINLTNKDYREFYYGGVEYEDSTEQGSVCYDATQEKINGEYPKQKYYLRGSLPGNYNCQKYLIASGQDKNGNPLGEARIADIKKSFDCCVQRSREYICIQENDNMLLKSYNFCKVGNRCNINGVYYDIWHENNQRLICAKSYSLCPYNFYLEGGTNNCDKYCDGVYEGNVCRLPKHPSNSRYLNAQEWNDLIKKGTCGLTSGSFNSSGNSISEVRDSDCSLNDKANKCRNYCQYMKHCTVAVDFAIRPISSITSPYFSTACINFIGDSKNVAGYDGGILGGVNNFSAPIAQCFRETMENLFFNRVGHSRCSNQTELPTTEGLCFANGSSNASYLTGNGFIYKIGTKVGSTSIFGNIQQKLQYTIKFFLTLSVMFFGYNVLLAKVDLTDKKTIMIYILKFAIVCFFSLGEAWQSFFFNGVYGASGELGTMVYNVRTPFGITSQDKMDGCQFGIVRSSSGEVVDNTNSDGVNKKTYPNGKQYLAMFDSIDCKIAKYLGIGVKGSVANITILILASIVTGPIGIYFCLMILIFGIMLIVMAIHALHIFICSSISLIIFVFISPLIFPMLLFEKTKSIFDAWFKEMIGFCITPMFLFAYIGLLISVMDMTLIGSATFIGSNPRSLNCNQYCVKFNGTYEKDTTKCNDARDIIVNPLDDSVLCLINIDNNSFSSYPGLEVLGVSIIALKNIFSDPSKTVIRILTILKAVLVIFLLYKFLNEIPGIAQQISGGTEMSLSRLDAFKMFPSLNSLMQGFIKRAKRGMANAAKYYKAQLGKKKGGEGGDDD